MKNIKLFENFDLKYLWADAIFWINKLEPEELCYLGIYSYFLEQKKKQPLFEVVYKGTGDNEPDDDGNGTLEMLYEFTSAKNENQLNPSLSCDIEFSGSFLDFFPGDYNNPPEGGEYNLNNIEINSIYYLDLDNNEYDLKNIEYKSSFITKFDLINLIKYVANYFINYLESTIEIPEPIYPKGLFDKCESIRNQNMGIKKGSNMLKRFNSGK